MTAQAFSISYGSNEANYITGESMKKDHPEKIFRVYDNMLSPHLNANGIWESMKLHVARHSAKHPKLNNSCMQIILSPAKEYTKDFTIDDWQKLWLDFVKELDGMEQFIRKDKSGREKFGRTNIAESKHTVWLHLESKGQTPHLHTAICRIDRNGNINDDHCIGKRVQKAAANVARARGWKTAMEVHEDRVPSVTKDCMDVLKEMNTFSLKDYFARLEQKGYEVVVRPDKQGVIHGYSLVKDNCSYKASELGKGRNLMVKNLHRTWEKLRDERLEEIDIMACNEYYKETFEREDEEQRKIDEQKRNAEDNVRMTGMKTMPLLQTGVKQQATQHTETKTKTMPTSVSTPISQSDTKSNPADTAAWQRPDYSEYGVGTESYTFRDGWKKFTYYIPKEVKKLLDDEFDFREVANWRELSDLAVQLFVGYLDAATTVTPSSGGGGGQSDLPWRDRKKDEDEIAFAKRCAAFARTKCGVVRKSGYRR